MNTKRILFTVWINFILAFLLQGISDPNVFILSNWRLNNVVNIVHMWMTFLTTYYLYSFIIKKGFEKLKINTSKRLIELLVVTQAITFLWVIVTDILFYVLYYGISSLSETTFYEFDIPLALAILTIGSIYFYQKHNLKQIGEPHSESQYEPTTQLEVFKGSQSILLPHSSVDTAYLSNKLVWIRTAQGDTYQTNYSISQLTELLPLSEFYRLNRQVIVSRKLVKGYNRLDYQKLEILLKEGPPPDLNLVVSKYNAPGFKEWLTKST